MAALPVTPAPMPAPEAAPLSEGARLVNVFVAPGKTFFGLRRNASWWAPFLIMAAISVIFVYTAGQKVGFRKAMENQMQTRPKQEARLEQLPPEQREAQLESGAKVTEYIAYSFPVIQLIILLIITTVLFATFKLAAGANVSFNISLAIVMYASLPGILRTILAMIALLAGLNPDSFSFQNPVGTNPAYYMNPADSPFLYSLGSSFDLFLIWTLVLTAIGFTCVSKVKAGTAYGIVFGWWLFFAVAGAGLAAAFA
jgi:hypothetical protein